MRAEVYRTPLEIISKVSDMEVNTEMTEQQARAVLREAMEFKEAEGLTHAQLAALCQCSGATWHQIRLGKYPSPIARFMVNFKLSLVDRLEQVKSSVGDYVSTSIGKSIQSVCRRAFNMPCIGRVVTPSGFGKTEAGRHFCTVISRRAIYVQAGVAHRSQKGLLIALKDTLRLPVTSYASTPVLYSAVRQKLAASYRGGKGLSFGVLIDEATQLSGLALNLLRNLHDDPDVRMGLVLMDTARLDAELTNPKLAGGFEQLRSRFGAVYCQTLADEIIPSDVALVTDSILSNQLGHTRKLHAHAYSYLHQIANTDGRLRNVFHRLHAVSDLAEAAGQAPTYSVRELDYAAQLMGQQRQLKHDGHPFGSREPEAARTAKAG
jgi:DNA transposition AAA+ family ATPase